MVDIAVAIAGKEDHPDIGHCHAAGERRRVKHQREKTPSPFHKRNHPGHEEGGQIAHRAGNHREEQGVFQRDQKHVVVQQQLGIILQPHELRGLDHVVIRHAVIHGHSYRHKGKHDKQHQKGQKEHIAYGVLLQPFSEAFFPVAFFQRRNAALLHQCSSFIPGRIPGVC